MEYSGIIVNSGEIAREEYGMETGKEVFVDCITTGPRTSGKYRQNGGMIYYCQKLVFASVQGAWRVHGPL